MRQELAISERAISADRQGFGLLPMSEIGKLGSDSGVPAETRSAYALLGNWVKSYLMSSHPQLGRSGAVCPFTSQAFRLDTIRIGISDATGLDGGRILGEMRDGFRLFAQIPCANTMKHFRTVVVGFPKLDGASGLAALKDVQAKLKFYSLMRGLMLGLFHAETNAPGLWNPDFRPLRSPIPVLAIRHLVANDAPFVMRHPLLVPTYIVKFPIAGPRKLFAQFARRFG